MSQIHNKYYKSNTQIARENWATQYKLVNTHEQSKMSVNLIWAVP